MVIQSDAIQRLIAIYAETDGNTLAKESAAARLSRACVRQVETLRRLSIGRSHIVRVKHGLCERRQAGDHRLCPIRAKRMMAVGEDGDLRP